MNEKHSRQAFGTMTKNDLWHHIKTLENRIDCLRCDKNELHYENGMKEQLIEMLKDENERLLIEVSRKDKLLCLVIDKLKK